MFNVHVKVLTVTIAIFFLCFAFIRFSYSLSCYLAAALMVTGRLGDDYDMMAHANTYTRNINMLRESI